VGDWLIIFNENIIIRLMNKKSLIALLLFISLVPVQAFAGCEGPIVPCGTEWIDNPDSSPGEPAKICINPCNLCHIFELLNNVLAFVLTCLVPIAATIMLVWGGFYFLVSGAKPTDVNKAKRIVTAAVVGLVIIFVAWMFLNTFLTSIGVAEWTGLEEGWWDIQCQ